MLSPLGTSCLGHGLATGSQAYFGGENRLAAVYFDMIRCDKRIHRNQLEKIDELALSLTGLPNTFFLQSGEIDC